MGRHYDGDISGKFWFGVQSSDAADRFGVYGEVDEDMEELYGEECAPLCYYFKEEHLPKVIEKIEEIEKFMGNKKTILDKFFDEKDSYNYEILVEYFANEGIEFDEDDVRYVLSDYADLKLGYEIKECIEKNGSCGFEADVC